VDTHNQQRLAFDTEEPPQDLQPPSAIPLTDAVEDLAVAPSESTGPGILETGRALVPSEFAPPSITAGERFLRFAYRMGIPGHTLAAPLRKRVRPRLLATVESPLCGDRVAGVALRAGHFLVLGTKTPIGGIDFGPGAIHTPPFERTVHGFGWLRDLAACAAREQCAPAAEKIAAAWLEANPGPAKGPAWKVGLAGHRLLNWLVHAPLILSGDDAGFRGCILHAMEETARHLDRQVSRAEDRLAELAGWCAITAAGLLMPDGKPRRLFGEYGLVNCLGDLVGEDGGVLSRSPLGQMEAIELLVELVACYRAVNREPPHAAELMLSLLVPPLLSLTHGDGGLGNWQGSGAVSADRVSALVEASGIRTRPLREARQWGYQRVASRHGVLQFDAAPPPLARHARHGCASTLAFEFSYGDQRIVVNCGGSGITGGMVPVRIERGLRATAAHSTLVLDDANSTAVLINGKLGTGVEEVELDRRMVETEGPRGAAGLATRLEASHDGYARRFSLVHRRILLLREDCSELRGQDLLVPAGRSGKKGKVPYAIRFHLGPGIEANLTENGKGAGLALGDGSYWQFLSGEEEEGLGLEESLWVDGEGRPHPIQQLVIQGMVSRGGGSFSWLLKKMG
jgi:uncharacterized heparinase superfamily protein